VHTSSGRDKGGIWEADASQELLMKLSTMKKNEQALTNSLFGRNLQERRSKFAVEIGAGATLIDGDYSNPTLRPLGRTALKYFFTPSFSISSSLNVFKLANKGL
jgi:curli production assembly/transport component CsgG